MWKRIGMFTSLFVLTIFVAPSIEEVVTEGSSAEMGRFIFTVALLLLLNLYIFTRQHN
ncbi:MAG: hypothetical protein ACPG8W_05830 [Candidatus Promineifilaceae bacterium]